MFCMTDSFDVGGVVRVIDSHTEGEPTRVVIEGGPDLGRGTMRERADRFAAQFDDFRKAMILEPRGSDILVGALLCPPSNDKCCAGVVFFNNVDILGMCGHGTIGVAVTLAHLGKVGPGIHYLDTPVGEVAFELDGQNKVTIQNVPSWRYRKDVALEIEGVGHIKGDIAWGGNWFFLTKDIPMPLLPENTQALTHYALQIRCHLDAHRITGANEGLIDHIELMGPPQSKGGHGRNFVLCPGAAYDRSPCGTGTSAKLACLAADGHLNAGEPWVQESVIGSRFVGSYQEGPGGTILPSVTGHAYIYSEAKLVRHPEDPFVGGVYRSSNQS
jgi:proline racemase